MSPGARTPRPRPCPRAQASLHRRTPPPVLDIDYAFHYGPLAGRARSDIKPCVVKAPRDRGSSEAEATNTRRNETEAANDEHN
ncbi:hypothetical protein EVAR_81736_1 [Eumeta japonica]|uniref:Uncharacterized protein n=1 Tax=Eumeta variegata TaxID=151549 RepID=A0A4C1UHG8_EUMVA|nr:hypothetical protein EVAR_81736_1 [Eumeta japonica]